MSFFSLGNICIQCKHTGRERVSERKCMVGYVEGGNVYRTKAATRGALQKSCSFKFRKLYRKTPVLESLFKKIADLQACNFILKRLHYKCYPLNFVAFRPVTLLKSLQQRCFPVKFVAFSHAFLLKRDSSIGFFL